MKELVEVIAKALVDNPDEVVVTEAEKDGEKRREKGCCGYSIAGRAVKKVADSWVGTMKRRRKALVSETLGRPFLTAFFL